MELVAVAAVAENGVIGDHGELPWESVPADKRQYRERVAGSPVILGRVTYESMLDDLPGDERIVLTSDADGLSPSPNVYPVESVEDAIDRARELTDGHVYVLGGGSVYQAFMPYVETLLISRIPGTYPGNVRFPTIAETDWQRVDTEPMSGFTLETWKRRESG